MFNEWKGRDNTIDGEGRELLYNIEFTEPVMYTEETIRLPQGRL